MDLKLENNTSKNRFEGHIDGEIAIIEYEKDGNTLKLIHTEVPKSLEGKGVASKMVKEVLASIKKNGQNIKPVCPFIKSYIEKHPEWQSMVK